MGGGWAGGGGWGAQLDRCALASWHVHRLYQQDCHKSARIPEEQVDESTCPVPYRLNMEPNKKHEQGESFFGGDPELAWVFLLVSL